MNSKSGIHSLLFLVTGIVWFCTTGCYSGGPTKPNAVNLCQVVSQQKTGLRLYYQPKLFANTNYLTSILFATSDWVEYFIDGSLVARHEPFEGLDTTVYLDPGEHTLFIQSKKFGLMTLGQALNKKRAQYLFNLHRGQMGTFKVGCASGDYGARLYVIGFDDATYFDEVE